MRLFIVCVLLSVLLSLSFPFAESDIVKAFNKCREFFFKKQPPVISGILNKHSLQDSYKEICQKYRNGYRFATFYDTANKIPVFSAFKYIGKPENFSRPDIPWMVEPQLDPIVEDMIEPYANQAINEDFFHNHKRLSRGHLFASSYAPDKLTAESTFTLTNIVPQKQSFNKQSWNGMEKETKDIMDMHCADENNLKTVLAYVMTGAIPGDAKMNDKVNIPSFMWMAFCCFNSTGNTWVSQAFWARNGDEDAKKKRIITKKSLQELQEFMGQKWNKNVRLFHKNCAK